MRTFPILLLTLTAFLPSCKDAGTEAPVSTGPVKVSFENVEHYESFAIPIAGTDVIRDDSTWVGYWRAYWNNYSGTGEKTPPPSIDFSKEMVVAAYYGNTYSGCSNKVEVIQEVMLSPTSLRVKLGPLPFLGYCRAIVAPIHMVKIPKSDLEVVFTGNVPQ
jgi:hypothetical protein